MKEKHYEPDSIIRRRYQKLIPAIVYFAAGFVAFLVSVGMMYLGSWFSHSYEESWHALPTNILIVIALIVGLVSSGFLFIECGYTLYRLKSDPPIREIDQVRKDIEILAGRIAAVEINVGSSQKIFRELRYLKNLVESKGYSNLRNNDYINGLYNRLIQAEATLGAVQSNVYNNQKKIQKLQGKS